MDIYSVGGIDERVDMCSVGRIAVASMTFRDGGKEDEATDTEPRNVKFFAGTYLVGCGNDDVRSSSKIVDMHLEWKHFQPSIQCLVVCRIRMQPAGSASKY